MLYNFMWEEFRFKGFIVKIFSKIKGLFFCLSFVLLSNIGLAKNTAVVVRTGIQPMNISRFVLEMTEDTSYKILYLDNPKRIVVDIPDVDVSKVKKESLKSGFISDVRIGKLDTKTSRVVLDLSTPAVVKKDFILKPLGNNKNYRLVLDIESVSLTEFSKFIGKKVEDVIEIAKNIIDVWLKTEFLDGKYNLRNEMLDNI